MADPTYLVCSAVEGPDDQAPVPSDARWCKLCAAEVWVSHIMLPEVDAGTVGPICPECFEGMRETQDDMTFEVHPRQRGSLLHQEVVRQFNRAERRRRARH